MRTRSKKPSTSYHPARRLVGERRAAATKGRSKVSRRRRVAAALASLVPEAGDAEIEIGGRPVGLTNLEKVYWPKLRITKGDLIRYYLSIADWVLPHIVERPMVMKRYPEGIARPFFFMKRTPSPRPEWLERCSIEHRSGNVIDFPVIQKAAGLAWLVNLGCIDLNPWYARCDDVDRPDFLHFDLDPVAGASFAQVRRTALVVREALEGLGMTCYAKTSGSEGMHLYVPIVRGPLQKQVWTFAKSLALALAEEHPKLITAEYRIARRPRGRVLVDYNQNAWGRTLAGVYSVRPRPAATVSAPVTWREVERGIEPAEFTLFNMEARLRRTGDLWRPLVERKGRFRLEDLLDGHAAKD